MNLIRKSIAEERAALNATIKGAQDRLAKLEKLAALAGDLFPDVPGQAHLGGGTLQSQPSTIQGVGQVTTKRDLILNASEQILSDGVWRDSRKLLPELAAHGVEVGGNNPVNNLSAYLSTAKDRFESDRQKGGWMVKGAKKPKGIPSPKDLTHEELLN